MRILRIAMAATALTAGVVVGGSMPATPAEAATPIPIQYVSRTVEQLPGHANLLLGTVGCPAGTFVVSAGADHGVLGSLSPIRNSRTSPDLANNTAVLVTGQGTADYPGGPKYLNVTAGCARAARLAGAVSRQVVLPPSTLPARRAVVTCPPGTQAFGGGAYTLGPDNRYTPYSSMFVNSVTSDGTGWEFRNLMQGATQDRLVVTTQCGALTGTYRIDSPAVDAPKPPTDFGTFPHTVAPCHSGYTALTGGVTWGPNNAGTYGTVRQITTFNTPGGSTGTYVEGYGSRLIARTVCVQPTSF